MMGLLYYDSCFCLLLDTTSWIWVSCQLCCAIYTRRYVIRSISGGERSPTRPKRRSKPYMEKRWFIPRKPFKKLIGLHSKRFRVSLELKELAQDLAGRDDCVFCPWLPLFFYTILHPLWWHHLLWVWFAGEGRGGTAIYDSCCGDSAKEIVPRLLRLWGWQSPFTSPEYTTFAFINNYFSLD